MKEWTLEDLYSEKDRLESILVELSNNPSKELYPDERDIIKKRFRIIADLNPINNKIADMEKEKAKREEKSI